MVCVKNNFVAIGHKSIPNNPTPGDQMSGVVVLAVLPAMQTVKCFGIQIWHFAIVLGSKFGILQLQC